jgi:predicted transcriptional regulator
MAKDKNTFNFDEEFQANPETAETHELNEAGVDDSGSTERQVYELKDGSEGSRAAYIREMFLEDNLSRKEIAEKTGFPYRVVYSATVNMVNEAEPAGRGRSSTNVMIKVHGEDKALVAQGEDGKYYDANSGEEVAEKDITEILRNDWIKEQVEAGVSRGDVAKALDLSYGVVYNLTKDQEGTRIRHEIELEDGTKISRSAYIRQLFDEGKTRSEIAKDLEVPYSVVWQATKVEKSDADKFSELVEQVKSYADKVTDADALAYAIEALENIEIKVSEEDEQNAVNAEAAGE